MDLKTKISHSKQQVELWLQEVGTEMKSKTPKLTLIHFSILGLFPLIH